MTRPTCLLASLANPRLTGVAPGLSVGEAGALVATPEVFSCCAGRGLCLLPDRDLTVSCPLGAHLRLARRVEAAWSAACGTLADPGAAAPTVDSGAPAAGQPETGTDHPVPSAAHFLARLRQAKPPRATAPGGWLELLASIARGERRRGLVLTEGAPLAAGSGDFAWALALAAAWRFRLSSQVVAFGRSNLPLLPGRDDPTPDLIIVTGVHRLWDAHQADRLAMLIGYAHGAMRPLFVGINVGAGALLEAGGEASSASGHQSAATLVRKRVDALKQRPWTSWLSAGDQARLASVLEISPGDGRPAPGRPLPRPP